MDFRRIATLTDAAVGPMRGSGCDPSERLQRRASTSNGDVAAARSVACRSSTNLSTRRRIESAYAFPVVTALCSLSIATSSRGATTCCSAAALWLAGRYLLACCSAIMRRCSASMRIRSRSRALRSLARRCSHRSASSVSSRACLASWASHR